MKRDENLQAGWKQPDQPQMEPGEEEMIPTGWMEGLTRRWAGTEYEMVLEKLKMMNGWPSECKNMRESIIEWLSENEETILIEEGEDILDGLEMMAENNEEGMNHGDHDGCH